MPVLILEPEKMAWIDENDAGTAHGGGAECNLKGLANNNRRTLIQFDITQIPANVTIVQAIMRIYFDTVGPWEGVPFPRLVTGAWDETVTWNTIPAFTANWARMGGHGREPYANTWMTWQTTPGDYCPKH